MHYLSEDIDQIVVEVWVLIQGLQFLRIHSKHSHTNARTQRLSHGFQFLLSLGVGTLTLLQKVHDLLQRARVGLPRQSHPPLQPTPTERGGTSGTRVAIVYGGLQLASHMTPCFHDYTVTLTMAAGTYYLQGGLTAPPNGAMADNFMSLQPRTCRPTVKTTSRTER